MLPLTASTKRRVIAEGLWSADDTSFLRLGTQLEKANNDGVDDPSSKCHFDLVPFEIAQVIFSYLNERQRVTIQRVSIQWKLLSWITRESIDFTQWSVNAESFSGPMKRIISRCSPSYLKCVVFSCYLNPGGSLSHIAPMLPNLRELILPNCGFMNTNISSQSMKSIGKWLTNLETLSLRRAEKMTPAHLGHLTTLVNLKNLRLGLGYSLYGHHLLFLTALRSLVLIDLEGNRHLNSSGLQYLSPLTKLTCLNISGCTEIDHHGITHLATLTSMRKLEMRDCTAIGPIAMQRLANLTDLRVLDLKNCPVEDEGIAYLAENNKNLEYVRTETCGLSAKGIQHFASLVKLKTLKLANNKSSRNLNMIGVKVEGVQSLRSLTRLTYLDLSWNVIFDRDLDKLDECINLSTLKLSRCRFLNGEFLQRLRSLTSLSKLDLSDCGHPPALASLDQLTSLRILDLKCTRTTDSDMLFIKTLTNLEELNLAAIPSLTPIGLGHLTSLVKLTKICLSGCHHVAIDYRDTHYITSLTHLREVVSFHEPPNKDALGIGKIIGLDVLE